MAQLLPWPSSSLGPAPPLADPIFSVAPRRRAGQSRQGWVSGWVSGWGEGWVRLGLGGDRAKTDATPLSYRTSAGPQDCGAEETQKQGALPFTPPSIPPCTPPSHLYSFLQPLLLPPFLSRTRRLRRRKGARTRSAARPQSSGCASSFACRQALGAVEALGGWGRLYKGATEAPYYRSGPAPDRLDGPTRKLTVPHPRPIDWKTRAN